MLQVNGVLANSHHVVYVHKIRDDFAWIIYAVEGFRRVRAPGESAVRCGIIGLSNFVNSCSKANSDGLVCPLGTPMKCPYCRNDNDKVIDSRSSQNGYTIRRRRECSVCDRRWTTYERLEESPLKVVKKDGTRTAFDRNKIRQGLDRACEKRPISESQIEAIIEQVEEDIYNLFDREVPTDYIGEQVIARLQQLDQVAYVRFASVYREFKDAHEFVAAVGSLNRGSKR